MDQCGGMSHAVDVSSNKPTWTSLCHLVDARDVVTDIKFAPRHVGLKLATCAMDGFIRIYEVCEFSFFWCIKGH